MLTWLLVVLIVLTLVATYVFWIRPILKTRPSLMQYYEREESLWAALSLKVSGLKQKLTTAVVMISGFVVSAYDFLAPLFAQSGVDVTTITSKIPAQAWPLIGMALIALVQYFRNLGDKRAAADTDAKG